MTLTETTHWNNRNNSICLSTSHIMRLANIYVKHDAIWHVIIQYTRYFSFSLLYQNILACSFLSIRVRLWCEHGRVFFIKDIHLTWLCLAFILLYLNFTIWVIHNNIWITHFFTVHWIPIAKKEDKRCIDSSNLLGTFTGLRMNDWYNIVKYILNHKYCTFMKI